MGCILDNEEFIRWTSIHDAAHKRIEALANEVKVLSEYNRGENRKAIRDSSAAERRVAATKPKRKATTDAPQRVSGRAT